MRVVLLIAVMGAVGSVSRYAVSGWAYRLFGAGFPYGTLAVNVVGSLVLGFLMHLGLVSDVVPRALRTALTVGFLGAFTTWSTFAYETVRYLEEGAWWQALGNVGAHLVIGLAAAAGGLALGRLLVGGA